MVYHNADIYVWQHGFKFFFELKTECCFIVDRDIGHYIYRYTIVTFKIVESMYLCDILMFGQRLNYSILQISLLVSTSSDSIYTNRHDDAVAFEHFF